MRIIKVISVPSHPTISMSEGKKITPTNSQTETVARNEIINGVCNMCKEGDCGTLVNLQNGVVTKVEGNPKSPTNQGKIDLRGLSAIMNLYNPYRVKTPLKRTNPEKGPDVDPKWVEITWDEALDTIATRLKKIREEDPRKLVCWEGFGNREAYLMMMLGPFRDAFGTPNVIGTHGVLCSIHYASNLVQGQHPEATFDIDSADYVIAAGRTVGPNVASACGSTRRFLNAVERGMKLVTIDPRRSIESSKAYRWVPVRPGTETAFALSIIHTILHELGTFDVWFVKNRTNGPYLIGPDGYYLRDKTTKKPLIWDPVDNKAKAFNDKSIKDYGLEGTYTVEGVSTKPAFQLIKDHMKEYTPEWAEMITTIPAETIRTITREFVEHARIGSTINIDGFEFPFRPAVFAGSGRGAISHKGGMYFDLAGKIVNALVGSIEVPGGITGCRPPGPCPEILQPDEDGVVTPFSEAVGWNDMWGKFDFTFPPNHVDMGEFYPDKHTAPHIAAKAILDPEKYHLPYHVEAFMSCGANPFRSVGQRDVFVDAYRKVPFVFTISVIFDESTMMADIVLPEHSFMERGLAKLCNPQHQTTGGDTRGLRWMLGRNPVKPLHNTRHISAIMIDLAERIGILYGEGGMNEYINKRWKLSGKYKLDLEKKYTFEEMQDKVTTMFFGDEEGLEYLQKQGVLSRRYAPGKFGYNYYYHPGNKTRHPIYFEHLKAVGDELKAHLKRNNIGIPGWRNTDEFFSYYEPIPRWIPSHEFDLPPGYDLYAINWKTNFMPFGCGDTQENPWLHEVRTNDPYEMHILINRGTASRKNLKDGDLVCVESRYGKTEGTIKTTELIHPEVVGIAALYGSATLLMNPIAKEGPYFNALISIDEEVSMDPLHGGLDIAPRVKIYRV